MEILLEDQKTISLDVSEISQWSKIELLTKTLHVGFV